MHNHEIVHQYILVSKYSIPVINSVCSPKRNSIPCQQWWSKLSTRVNVC